MTKTHEETQAQLDDMVAKMMDADIPQPEAMILQKSGGNHAVHLRCKYNTKALGDADYTVFSGEIEDAISKAFDFIAKLPDRETAAKQNWHGKLAEVIDEGHALALPDTVMQPLRQGSQAMTENLLAAPEGV